MENCYELLEERDESECDLIGIFWKILVSILFRDVVGNLCMGLLFCFVLKSFCGGVLFYFLCSFG